MKPKISLLVCILTGVALTVMAPRSGFADEQGRIEGAWVISITGGVGTPTLPSWYQALATFTHEGGLIETITDPSIGTGHGRWAKVHGREFAVTTLLFRFDATGDLLGTLKARATIALDKTGNEFTSDEYLFEFFDRNGTLLTSGVGKAHGSRIVVQPLP
jgi:hypothetical protein